MAYESENTKRPGDRLHTDSAEEVQRKDLFIPSAFVKFHGS